jgi:hypothetical protein
MTLIMTSTDGFASMVIFDEGELGQPYEGPLFSLSSATASEEENKENATVLFSKDDDTPMLETPSTVIDVFVRLDIILNMIRTLPWIPR